MVEPAVLAGEGGAAAAAAVEAVEAVEPAVLGGEGGEGGSAVAAVAAVAGVPAAKEDTNGEGMSRVERFQRAVVAPRRRLPTARECLDGVRGWTLMLLQDSMKCAFVLAGVFFLAVAFVRLAEGIYAKPCSRGYTLSPGDSPLLPGECIEGRGGFRRLGFLPGASRTPRLEMLGDGGMLLQRPDGSEVFLAKADVVNTAKSGILCRTERLVRGVVGMGTPVFGARSRVGRLMVGSERFCSADQSLATVSSRSLAKVWREGGGILGFSEKGDLEMVTTSGEVIWSHAEGGRVDQIKRRRRRHKKVAEALAKKEEDARRKRLERISKDLEQTARRRQREKEKEGESEKDTDQAPKKKKKKKGGRRRVFGRSNGAASEAATDTPSATAHDRPSGRNVFVRVLSWGRPSPKGAGGQSG